MGVHTLEVHEIDLFSGLVSKTIVLYEIAPSSSTFNPTDFLNQNDTQADDLAQEGSQSDSGSSSEGSVTGQGESEAGAADKKAENGKNLDEGE